VWSFEDGHLLPVILRAVLIGLPFGAFVIKRVLVALYRRGALADAVVAHSTTNALLSVYVLATRHWFLWN